MFKSEFDAMFNLNCFGFCEDHYNLLPWPFGLS